MAGLVLKPRLPTGSYWVAYLLRFGTEAALPAEIVFGWCIQISDKNCYPVPARYLEYLSSPFLTKISPPFPPSVQLVYKVCHRWRCFFSRGTIPVQS